MLLKASLTTGVHGAQRCRRLEQQHQRPALLCTLPRLVSMRHRQCRVLQGTTADVLSRDSSSCITEEDGAVLVRDDLDALLKALPEDIREPLINHPCRKELLEMEPSWRTSKSSESASKERESVVLDLGRRPEARFQGKPGGEFLREAEVTAEDLRAAEAAVGAFGRDNRAGVAGTLHRISAIRNRRDQVIGLTCRVGRAVSGHADLIRDLVESNSSVLLLGRPGVGKTTVIREVARLLSDEMRKRVVIVDTSNEIGGDGDVPHPAIGGARRMQVPDPSRQHHVMIEAVENHMPEVIIVDEIGSEAEARACRTIAERGITLIGTAHGRVLDNLMQNPTLCDLIGGIESVTLGDETARLRGTKKTVLERKAPPTFPIVVEIRDRCFYVAHWTQDSVDHLLQGQVPSVQVRDRDPITHEVRVQQVKYDQVTEPVVEPPLGESAYAADYNAALAQRQQQQLREEAAAAVVAAGAEDVLMQPALPLVLNNVLPMGEMAASRKDVGSVGAGPSAGSARDVVASLREEYEPLRAGSGRGFGPSSFVKPHVSVMSGKQGMSTSKRSKGKASAKKAR